MTLPVNDVPRGTSSYVKTLGLKHPQLPDVDVSSGPSDGAHIVHHGTHELPTEQDTVLYGGGHSCSGENPASGQLSS